MGRIIREIDRGTRSINSTEITLTELVWDNGGRSFDVHLTDGTMLTELESFDTMPGDEQLLDLLAKHRSLWHCPSCYTTIAVDAHDLVAEHTRTCFDGSEDY